MSESENFRNPTPKENKGLEETIKQENSGEQRTRKKRAVIDCPPRTNTGADGFENHEFK